MNPMGKPCPRLLAAWAVLLATACVSTSYLDETHGRVTLRGIHESWTQWGCYVGCGAGLTRPMTNDFTVLLDSSGDRLLEDVLYFIASPDRRWAVATSCRDFEARNKLHVIDLTRGVIQRTVTLPGQVGLWVQKGSVEPQFDPAHGRLILSWNEAEKGVESWNMRPAIQSLLLLTFSPEGAGLRTLFREEGKWAYTVLNAWGPDGNSAAFVVSPASAKGPPSTLIRIDFTEPPTFSTVAESDLRAEDLTIVWTEKGPHLMHRLGR